MVLAIIDSVLDSFPQLPLSLDPLMAEAKRRAKQRRALIAFGVVLVAGLAVGLTLALRSGGGPTVTTGMTANAVRAKLGPPVRIVRSNPRNPDCWAYPRGDWQGKPHWWSTYGEHVAVCFKHGHVDYVGP